LGATVVAKHDERTSTHPYAPIWCENDHFFAAPPVRSQLGNEKSTMAYLTVEPSLIAANLPAVKSVRTALAWPAMHC
jgi:hypothetical protein